MTKTWTRLSKVNEIDSLIEKSHQEPVIILKHSTRCPISSIAKQRLETDWDLDADAYINLVVEDRTVSNYIADTLDVQHESPQLVIIKNGEVVYDTSHLDISIDAVKEGIKAKTVL